jgi:hypothetical protein
MTGVRKEFIIDNSRKIKYFIGEWTNEQTGDEYFVARVTLYKKRRRISTLGLTKKWSSVERIHDKRVEKNKAALKERIDEMRSIVLGESADPLEKLLDDILAEVEPNHNT